MKIDFLSDIHVDFHIKEKNISEKLNKIMDGFILSLKPNKHDVLIIAGDLGHYFTQDTTFLLRIKKWYNHIILVRGNHDMYLISKGLQKKYLHNSMNRVLEMKRWCSNQENIHYLDGETICIDGITFGGVGMSWDYSFAKENNFKESKVRDLFPKVMNDGKLIFADGQKNYTLYEPYGREIPVSYFKQDEYFKKELDKLKSIDEVGEVDVMITHYGPDSNIPMRDEYKKSYATTYYYFDGKKEIERIKPMYWIHGHTHDKYRMQGFTTLLCNPLGYPNENPEAKIESIEIY